MEKKILSQQRDLVRNPQGPVSWEEDEGPGDKNDSEEGEMNQFSAGKETKSHCGHQETWAASPSGSRPGGHESAWGRSLFP